MRVSNANKAIVPGRKITAYLLNLAHAGGRAKARFFLGRGYSLTDWQQLADDLRGHVQAHAISGVRRTVGGTHYEVTGAMAMPNGSTARIVSVWYIADGETVPRLATAYPMR